MNEEYDSNGLLDKCQEEANSITDSTHPNNPSNDNSLSSAIEPNEELINNTNANKANAIIVLSQKSSKKKAKWSIVEIILILMAIGLLIVAIAYFVIYFITKTIPTLFDDDSFIKPYIDKKIYKVIRLHNGIEVTLISEKNSSSSAMSISLNVSSLNENPQMPGIAALAKRIMMLNSTREANRTNFNNHLAKHFGRFESSINDSMISFYFKIGKAGFYDASVQFANLFKYPLINELEIKKEIELIQTDYSVHLQDLNSLTNVLEHRIVYDLDSYFPYGNNETLNSLNISKTKSELESYINANFISNNIKVVLLGTNSIDDLKGIAIRLFSDIPSINSLSPSQTKPYVSQIAYKKKDNLHLGQLVFLMKNNANELKIIFYLKRHSSPQSDFYLKYFEYLLNDRKPKSIATVLKFKNYTNYFAVNYETISEHLLKFTINIDLSYFQSNNNQFLVVKHIFNYLRLIRDKKNHSEIYSEMRLIFTKNFSFKSNPNDHLDFVRSLNQHMFTYENNLTMILFEKDYVPMYDESILRFYIDQFIAQNCVIIYGSPWFSDKDLFDELPQDKTVFDSSKFLTEKYFKAKYAFSEIKEIKMTELNKINEYDYHLELRSHNNYITALNDIKNISDGQNQSIVPQIIFESRHLYLWHNVIYIL